MISNHTFIRSRCALNPDWTRRFSPQTEIWSYLQDCAHQFGLMPHLRFNESVMQMTWDEAAGEWAIDTNRGQYRARLVIAAFGFLSEPAIPRLEGMGTFEGQVFHSAQWPAGLDPRGLQIAVIGTGASAVQLVPAIQPEVARLYVFQRTAPWVMKRGDHAISPRAQRLYRGLPLLQKAMRLKIYLQREILVLGFKHPGIMKVAQRDALHHLEQSIRDPQFRKRLTPQYVMGCKRILLSDDYYPSLAQANVELVTAGIQGVTATGIVTTDGACREVDTIVFGTGFEVGDPPFPRCVHGTGGRTLAEAWSGSPKAYMGTMVAGFPNFFILSGPNTGLGHNSVIYMAEAQIEHVLRLLKNMKRRGYDIIEPRTGAQSRYVGEMDRAMRGTVWNAGGCRSWYLDRNGRNSAMWPGSTLSFRWRALHVQERDYEGRRAGGQRE